MPVFSVHPHDEGMHMNGFKIKTVSSEFVSVIPMTSLFTHASPPTNRRALFTPTQRSMSGTAGQMPRSQTKIVRDPGLVRPRYTVDCILPPAQSATESHQAPGSVPFKYSSTLVYPSASASAGPSNGSLGLKPCRSSHSSGMPSWSLSSQGTPGSTSG